MDAVIPQSERAKKGALKGRTCTVEHCGEAMYSRLMCKRHYKQANRTGTAKPGVKGMHGPVEQRFWHYATNGDEDTCWLWTGRTDKDGYGTLRTPTSLLRAHRVSFEMHKGPIPEGHLIRHRCHTPACVNPNHLLTGTHLDNAMDKVLAGRSLVNEDHPNTKFSNAVVAEVRAAMGKRKDIARQFGMSESQVGNIRSGAQRPVPSEELK